MMVTRRAGKMARPTKMTKAVLGKLEQAFAYGSSDKEACFYADINPDTLYEYQKQHPEFTERKEALKERPVLQARQKVVGDIKNDVKVAQWYLERKRKSEFAQRQELTGDEGAAINVIIEDTYAKQPKFRTDNNNAEADDLAEDSSR